MNSTKHNLSSGLAELDFQALITTAEIAVSMIMKAIEKYTREMRCDWAKKEWTSLYLDGGNLKEEAFNLAIACETLATLKKAQDREEIKIINKF